MLIVTIKLPDARVGVNFLLLTKVKLIISNVKFPTRSNISTSSQSEVIRNCILFLFGPVVVFFVNFSIKLLIFIQFIHSFIHFNIEILHILKYTPKFLIRPYNIIREVYTHIGVKGIFLYVG
jgi:hypothetical protein